MLGWKIMIKRLGASRRAWFLRSIALAVAAGLSLVSGGCASLVGVQDTEVTFSVQPGASGTFFWWNEITIDQDANSVNGARLLAVTLDVTQPAGTSDLSFL